MHQIGNIPGLLQSAPQSPEALDKYQAEVVNQALYDNDTRVLIDGLPPEVYMFWGLREEMGELWQADDKAYPDYNPLLEAIKSSIEDVPAEVTGLLGFQKKMSRVLQIAGVEAEVDDLPSLDPAEVSRDYAETARRRHLPEFGDVNWYIGNMLNLYGVRMSEALQAGVHSHEIQEYSPDMDRYYWANLEMQSPWLPLLGCVDETEELNEAMLRRNPPYKEKSDMLAAGAGRLILAMSHLLVVEFDTSYNDVLKGNIDKVEERLATNTVYSRGENGD